MKLLNTKGDLLKCLLMLHMIFLVSYSNLLGSEGYTFDDFVRQFNRNYSSIQQFGKRKLVFEANYQKILQEEINANGTYHLTINNFTDWTEDEFKSFFTYQPNKIPKLFSQKNQRISAALTYPSSLDYRAMGKVSDVKDQGQCGDCWAFSTTGHYQSLLLIEGRQQYDLAQQYALDCTSGSSCNGGYPKDAIDMFIQTGIPLETAYPYKQQNGYYGSGICSASNRIKLNSAVNSVNHYNSMTDAQLKQALTDHGPVSIGIYATSTFSSYSSGVYSGCPAGSSAYINHAVLLVGYTSNGDWIVKNSWGADWGDQGFVIISKNYDCGLKTFVDVIDITVAPSPSPSPSPSPTPSPNSTYVNYTVYLMDTYGDGWSGLILGIRQEGSVISTFGQGFQNGSNFGPLNVLVKQNVLAEIVVVQFANYTSQISFELYDQNKSLVYTRQCRVGNFQKTIIFHSWCPGSSCISPNSSKVYVTMTDSWGDGWNGNSIAFRQSGNITATFGSDFLNGHMFGPVQITLLVGVQAQIIVNTLGSYRNEIGFIIRDKNGIKLFSRDPGQTYFAYTIFGTICATCLNYADIRESGIGDPKKQVNQRYTGLINTSQANSSNTSSTIAGSESVLSPSIPEDLKPQIRVLLGVFSFFTLFFMITTIILFILWRNQRFNKFFNLQTDHNSIGVNQSGLLGVNSQNLNTINSGRTSYGITENKYRAQAPIHHKTISDGLFISA